MSDEETEVPERRLPSTGEGGVAGPIRFGSLADQEAMRMDSGEEALSDAAVVAGKNAGNINFEPDAVELEELEEKAQRRRAEHEEMVAQLALRKRAKLLALPTSDADVRSKLRAFAHPMTLFGEGPGERRERLRGILLDLDQSGVDVKALIVGDVTALTSAASQGYTPNQLFYTEGTARLKRLREGISHFSLSRARRRLAAEKTENAVIAGLYRGQYTSAEELAHRQCREARYFSNLSSQVGDDRPLTGCRLSPRGDMVATVGWGGACKLWDVASSEMTQTLLGHIERTVSVDFHPGSGLGNLSPAAVNVATAAADKTARLWSLTGEDEALAVLEGHSDRLAHVRFHPSGRLIATTSFDLTWRLWDVERCACLYEQEGHSLGVYGIAFQGDGALCCTTSLDHTARVWDIRSGRCVRLLEGHVKQVLGVDFSPNGFHVATGSDDHMVRVWDLRRKECLRCVAAHPRLVSSVRYEPETGSFFATSGFDGTVKMFSGSTFATLKTLGSHEGKVTCVDIARGGQRVVSTSFDRTFKIWSRDELLMPVVAQVSQTEQFGGGT